MWSDENLVKVLLGGGVAVIPTDTLYGVVGRALDTKTVERIYQIKNRVPDKPLIILIGSEEELKKFSINLSSKQKEILKKYWPGPVSIIFDCNDSKFEYLHRGTKTLAFRIPNERELRDLLMATGPLVVPSANPEGMPPAENIPEAKYYFKEKVDLYVDGGERSGKASRLIMLSGDGRETVLRV